MRVIDPRWRPPLPSPATFNPSSLPSPPTPPTTFNPLPGVLITHGGPQIPFGHSWTSEAHRPAKGRIYGSLTDRGGSERVCFKEEDELVVLSYARRRIMMWLSTTPPISPPLPRTPAPSPPTAGEPTHGFKPHPRRRRVLESLAWIKLLLCYCCFLI